MKAKNAQSYAKSRNVIDADTGEAFTLTDTTSTWGDRDFHKIFMKNFRKTLKGIKDQKLQVVLWLMENMTPYNQVLSTYQEIADGAKTSYQTVVRTIEMLEKYNFLCRTVKEGLLVNPNVVFRGRYESRSRVLEKYQEVWTENRLAMPDKEERERLNLELVRVDDDLKKALEEVKKLEGQKRQLEKRLIPRRKPGPKKKDNGESKDGTGQTSEQKPKLEEEKKDSTGQTSEQEPNTKEEEKDSAAQASEPNPRPEEEEKDGTGQTSEQET